jgi:hypothetical protein
MLEKSSTPYDVYLETLGKVRTGAKLESNDFSFRGDTGGLIPFTMQQRLAAAIAAAGPSAFLSKTELDAEISRLSK